MQGELVRWMAAYPRHPVILTSRAQDELWRRLRDEVGRAVVVQPIAGEQARAYLIAHLGRANGRALYARLDQRLQAMARMPLILWLIKEAGAAGESIPGNRGELYARFVSRMLRRDTERRIDAEIPERVKRLALAGLAHHLGLAQRLTCPLDEAVDVVARRLGTVRERAEGVVGACARHGLLAGEEVLWFAPHQTVQEHFGALALREMADQEWGQGAWAQVRRAGRQLLTGRPQGLTGLAADDWWTETIVQLAGLVDDADRLARDVARANPWLAWWCVAEGREVSDTTRAWVEDRSVRLLRSERANDRRRAVQALVQIQSERTIDPLFQAAADDDIEIAGLAVEALLGIGQAVRARVVAALRGMDPRRRLSALRYLAMQPDESLCREIPWEQLAGQPMVWVPPGPFLMGSRRTQDPQAYDEELPQHEVTLPGYWIDRYPVTIAQFRAFVQDSGYRPGGEVSLAGLQDRPVVNVTWHDALAYCRWLAERTGLPVRLPSEAEWEKAARGTDGRLYPWGDEPPDESRCNFGDTVGRTTAVGTYSPQGDSPHGCADMAGNVWEWCASLYKEYPYRADDGREDPEEKGSRVLRGGSWLSYQRYARCAYRIDFHPDSRLSDVGVRVVMAPALHF